MRSLKALCLTAVAGLTLAFFASSVDARRYGDPPASAAIQCDAYARDIVWWSNRDGRLAAGTLLGALAGFGIGSIFAASGIGAAIGAPIGLAVGAAVRTDYDRGTYESAYQRCMSGRAG